MTAGTMERPFMEHAVFVPSGEEYVGATLTVPVAQATGLVIMLTGGGGVPRSHRFSLWTKVSRRLATHGIASMRMEWPGTGDSTGQNLFTFDAIPVAHVLRVTEFAIAATGLDRVGILGNCGGARAALMAAREIAGCESVVTIFLQPLGGSGLPGLSPERVDKLLPGFRRLPTALQQTLAKTYSILRRAYFRVFLSRKPGQSFMDDLRELHQSVHILLMESDTELAGGLPRFVRSLQRGGRGCRIAIEYLTGTTMQQFETLEEQALVINHTVSWFLETFNDPATPRSVGPRSVGRLRPGDSRRRVVAASPIGS